ncbi:hypothetical protein N1851_017039 [Merluccius polli]|uniref:Uncharacterized protein n=1 Tax=Merluccius polli TaxID=89951 RepID=A0AA47NZD8_MERPO|nr:hypothetical protein N1851_017039 [Merluccius polli]
MSREDHQFMDVVMESAKRIDGHYTTCLPLKNRMEYTNFMDDILQKGYAVQLTEESTCNEGKVWYIPHHAVYHPVKQKLRVVFDCAAPYQGTSLNDQLFFGIYTGKQQLYDAAVNGNCFCYTGKQQLYDAGATQENNSFMMAAVNGNCFW